MVRNQSGQVVGVQMTDATTGGAFSGTVTVYVTGDAGTQAIGTVGSGVCTDEGNGYYSYTPSAAETNYTLCAFTFIGTGAVPKTVQEFTSAFIRNRGSQVIGAQMVNATTGAAYSGTVTVYITGDGGTQAIGSVGSGVCTDEGNGYYTYAPAQPETNYTLIAFTFVGSGAIGATIPVETVAASSLLPTFGDLYQDRLDIELGTNDSAVLFTTARRRQAIDEGLRQFADLTECLTRRISISCTNGQQEFDLNASSIVTHQDFLRVASEGPVFQISDSNGLVTTIGGDSFPQQSIPYLDAANEGWRSTNTGYPSGWYLRRDYGALYFGLDRPVGLSTGSTQTAAIVLPYVPNPSTLTDTQVPFESRSDLVPYQQAAVHFAAHDLEKLRKDKEASDRQLQKFQGYVSRYLGNDRPKGNRTVRVAVSYFKNARKSRGDRGVAVPEWR